MSTQAFCTKCGGADVERDRDQEHPGVGTCATCGPTFIDDRPAPIANAMHLSAAELLREYNAALAQVAALADQKIRLQRLAREAVNGWACYASRKIEHTEIARLHRALDEEAASR